MDIRFKRTAIALAVICAFGAPLTANATVSDVTRIQHHDDNAWLEIDAENFNNNLTILRNDVLSNGTKICAVMKSDAYGHGVSLLIDSVMKQGIDRICVANNSEARAARDKGFKGTIIRIRIATLSEMEQGLGLDIEEMAGNLAVFQGISRIGTKHNKPMRVHLNLNSGGMSRNGLEISTESGKQHMKEILRLPNVTIAGIMSHFPDEITERVEQGVAQFKKDANWVIQLGGLKRKDIILHCANTFATANVKSAHLDMVRVGSLIYGMNAPHIKSLKPVMSMKSRVGSVQHYKKGNTVVYDRTFTLQRDSQLANIPVGYSDGYNRSFSNRTQVLINGKRYPVVGKITMNTIMVDVTGSSIQPGDEVVLLGEQGSETISINELMASSYTFYGEFFMNVGYANPKFLKR